jgi:hypothetical protein
LCHLILVPDPECRRFYWNRQVISGILLNGLNLPAPIVLLEHVNVQFPEFLTSLHDQADIGCSSLTRSIRGNTVLVIIFYFVHRLCLIVVNYKIAGETHLSKIQ